MRVLLVEDEPRIAEYVRRGLTQQGYAVDVAHTGLDALAWAEAVSYDLIVLDILLPEMDGVSVCRELRKRHSPSAILMLTAREGIEDRVEGLDAGADDYLVKPFALRELIARLRALSRRSAAGPRTPLLELDDLHMDTATRRVTRAGMDIRLTAREYAVLECLLRRPGHVLSRSQIAEQVWNYDDSVSSNVVDVHIRNLRRKLDDPFASRLLHTVRGAGYCLSRQAVNESD